MTRRLLALSLFIIVLLLAYGKNRVTHEEHEATRRQEEKAREAAYYRKHPSRLIEKQERDLEYDEWIQSEEGQRIQAMTQQYLEMEAIKDVVEEAFENAE